GHTYTVDSTLDEPAANPSNGLCVSTPSGRCTLRAAIMASNVVTGPNTILLPAGLYTITHPGYDDNALVGDYDISHDLTLQGAGAAATIVDGNGTLTGDRVFQVFATVKHLTLSGLTIRNGQAQSSTFNVVRGGGLYITGIAQVIMS